MFGGPETLVVRVVPDIRFPAGDLSRSSRGIDARLSLSLLLLLSYTHTHTLSHSLSLSHTHTHTRYMAEVTRLFVFWTETTTFGV